MNLRARIQHGHGRGRHLGAPTLNLDTPPEALEFGVYAARVRFVSGAEGAGLAEAVEAGAGLADAAGAGLADAAGAGVADAAGLAVMHWGPRPTFDEQNPVAEVHVLDAFLEEAQTYGQIVEVELGPRLRGVQHFADSAALMAQIQADLAAVRKWGRGE